MKNIRFYQKLSQTKIVDLIEVKTILDFYIFFVFDML